MRRGDTTSTQPNTLPTWLGSVQVFTPTGCVSELHLPCFCEYDVIFRGGEVFIREDFPDTLIHYTLVDDK